MTEDNVTYLHSQTETGFCGQSDFWDSHVTWSGDYPGFTGCFQNTVLLLLPSAVLWLASVPYITWLCHSEGTQPGNVVTGRLFISKIVLTLFVCITSITNTVYAAVTHHSSSETTLQADVILPAIRAVTMTFAICILQLSRRRGHVTCGVLFFFWLLELLVGIIPFYIKIIELEYKHNLFSFVLFYLDYTLVFIVCVLHSFAESRESITGAKLWKPHPESCASTPSLITFAWVTPLIIRGYRRTLTIDNIWKLDSQDKCKTVLSRFEVSKHKYWPVENCNRPKADSREQSGCLTEESPLLPSNIDASTHVSNDKRTIPLGKILFRAFACEVLIGHMFTFLYDILAFLYPLLQKLLIDFTNEKNTEQAWKGYLYALAFYLVTFLQPLCMHQFFYRGTRSALRVRNALIAAIYKKSLVLTPAARNRSTTGQIVTLMSVDCEHVLLLVQALWSFWSAPLLMVLSIAMLYMFLGPATFAGVGVTLLLIPMNALVMNWVERFQAQLMEEKDSRIKSLNEIMHGIRVLKLHAWEPAFQKRVDEIRARELIFLRRMYFVRGFVVIFSTLTPFLIGLATFTTYVFTSDDHYLSADKVFVSLILLAIQNDSISSVPQLVTEYARAKISFRRISEFLSLEEIDQNYVQHSPTNGNSIEVDNGTFTWELGTQPCLKSVNLSVSDGQLLAVAGRVGSGKSSLISALLGNLEHVTGTVHIRGTLAYVPQEPWIMNTTLRQNILFGKPMNQQKYDDVIHACALRPDLKTLPAGDLTEIGEKGINISGGQRQRVALARAVYSDADIYILDDPLSAVDAYVGKHIFQYVIASTGLLASKTRVLVTHAVQWLPETDRIVVMDSGRIVDSGTYDDLISREGTFAGFLQGIDSERRKTNESQTNVEVEKEHSVKDEQHVRSLSESKDQDNEEEGRIIEDELAATGHVKWSVYWSYIRAVGVTACGIILLMYITYHTFEVVASIWLSKWTDDQDLGNATLPANSSYRFEKNSFYLGIYGAFGGVQAMAVFGYSWIVAIRLVVASRALHSTMFRSVLRSPMTFFDTTPTGRIMNRFSKDINSVDEELPDQFGSWIASVCGLLAVVVVVSYSTPIFLTVAVPITVLYFLIQAFYVRSSRQLKRLESTTRSPIFSHFTETIAGVEVVRSFNAETRFTEELCEKTDLSQSVSLATAAASGWLGIILESIGNLAVLAAAMFAVAERDTLTGGTIGLSLTYVIGMTYSLSTLVRTTSSLETNIVAVERIKEYSDLPSEPEWELPERKPPPDWPQTGEIAFQNFSSRYRPGLDLVLKNILFNVRRGENVGIVGRTGAGKSSLSLAMFRMIEATSGSICVDGTDIASIGLHDLRRRISVLPQNPVLFSGSVRMNLDPSDMYTDQEIWAALRHAHMDTHINSLPQGLTHDLSEGGRDFSSGQRQLLCLARSLLRKSRILILDEATAAVDMETDELIQRTVREEFSDCTILTIAHRLRTVLDCDKVAVMVDGELKEYDSPGQLLNDSSSLFYNLAQNAGLV